MASVLPPLMRRPRSARQCARDAYEVLNYVQDFGSAQTHAKRLNFIATAVQHDALAIGTLIHHGQSLLRRTP